MPITGEGYHYIKSVPRFWKFKLDSICIGLFIFFKKVKVLPIQTQVKAELEKGTILIYYIIGTHFTLFLSILYT